MEGGSKGKNPLRSLSEPERGSCADRLHERSRQAKVARKVRHIRRAEIFFILEYLEVCGGKGSGRWIKFDTLLGKESSEIDLPAFLFHLKFPKASLATGKVKVHHPSPS